MSFESPLRVCLTVYAGMLAWNLVPVSVVTAIVVASMMVSTTLSAAIAWLMKSREPSPFASRPVSAAAEQRLERQRQQQQRAALIGSPTNRRATGAFPDPSQQSGGGVNLAPSGGAAPSLHATAISNLLSALFSGVVLATMACAVLCYEERVFYGPYGVCVTTIDVLHPPSLRGKSTTMSSSSSSSTTTTTTVVVDCAEEWWLMLMVRCALAACFVSIDHYMDLWPQLERRRRTRLAMATLVCAGVTFLFVVLLLGEVPLTTGSLSSPTSVTVSRTVPSTFYRSDSWFEASRVTVVLSCVSMLLHYALFPIQLLCSWWCSGEASVEPTCTASLFARAVVTGLTAVISSSFYASDRMPWLVQLSLLASGYEFVAAVGALVRFRNNVRLFPLCTGSAAEETCVVCLSEMTLQCRCRQLPCGHTFHEPCLQRWLMDKHSCPVCRRPVFPRDPATAAVGGGSGGGRLLHEVNAALATLEVDHSPEEEGVGEDEPQLATTLVDVEPQLPRQRIETFSTELSFAQRDVLQMRHQSSPQMFVTIVSAGGERATFFRFPANRSSVMMPPPPAALAGGGTEEERGRSQLAPPPPPIREPPRPSSHPPHQSGGRNSNASEEAHHEEWSPPCSSTLHEETTAKSLDHEEQQQQQQSAELGSSAPLKSRRAKRPRTELKKNDQDEAEGDDTMERSTLRRRVDHSS